MDAQFLKHFGTFTLLLLLITGENYADSTFETANFAVNAPCAQSAQQFAEIAEQYRKDLAILWLGSPLPNWAAKCPVKIHVGTHLGAGGRTSFVFENGEVFGWEMEIQGSYERIIDSVLPHEITHTILASHFREPIPRWLDEGLATYVEHQSEKAAYRQMLRQYLQPNVQRCFPLNRLVAMKDYPDDPMPFYAQGLSLVEYLIQYGRQFENCEYRRLIHFAQSGMSRGDWQAALQEHYGIDSLGELQLSWVSWVGGTELASTLPVLAELPSVAPPDYLMSASISVQQSSAKLPPPPANSVYERRTAASPVQMIPVQWTDERAVPIPVSFGREVVLQ
ncbi:MAG: hypothetical protein FWG73_00845 [Planctomycetaceae bacterium]|nr:hypothetical protein [Planctomycetaceae bacterium]